MLVTINNLVMYFSGKSLIKLTWPGKQAIKCIRQIKTGYIIFGIVAIGLLLHPIKSLNQKHYKRNLMVTRNFFNLIALRKASKSGELFLATKITDTTRIKRWD